MLPLITLRKQKNLTADFGDYFNVSTYKSHSGIVYSALGPPEFEPKGRFFVSANTDNGELDGYISIGYVNGLEPENDGQRISINSKINGMLPGYVCLKLKAPFGGGRPASGGEPATCGEVVVQGTFGVDGEYYFHPIAKFTQNGKVAQCVNSDIFYKAYRKNPSLTWIHTITAA